MDPVRNFIRSILEDSQTVRFLEEAAPGEMLFYDPDEVWDSAMDLVEWLEVELTTDKDLRFFVLGESGEVAAAAYTNCNESSFGFEIVLDPDYDYLREELVEDCLAEYDYFKDKNPNLMLEVGSEMVMTLQEHGFRVLSGSLLSE